MRGTATDGTRNYGSSQLAFAASVVTNGRNMASNIDPAGTIYRWIERKPLTEAVLWTSKEKFWLILGAIHYGINDWKTVAQLVRNAGEPYRPREWYTSKSCERQFKTIITNISKELKLLPFTDMLKHLVEVFKKDYVRDTEKANEILKAKYLQLTSIVNRVKQGNLSRAEVVNLYSQARRFETDGKQYLEQLMTRQIASLTAGNLGSEEPIKWNAPSAPLLTSLLKSHNTIPANRTVNNITSLMQTPGGTSRTRSGKLLPLSSSVRTVQGTPTLSKLLEAPANPYIPSSPQCTQKNKSDDVTVTEKLIGNASKKENSESLSSNRVRVDTLITPGSINQINKSDLSLKRQTSKSPISGVKNGSKVDLNIINLLSDSESEESNKSPIQGIQPKNLFGDKKDINNSKIEQRATRSQTRAEGGFKQLTDNKLSTGKKEGETLRQQCEESQITETHPIDDLIDIDQIDVEPLSLVSDNLTTQTPTKITRSTMQRLRLNTPIENAGKVNSKEISNQMLEEISANFVLNSTIKNVATEYKNVMVGQSRIDNSNISGCFIPVDSTTIKDTILLRKDSQPFSNPVNTLTTFDGKLLRQKRIIELKGANIRIDGRTDKKFISFANQPIVVVNKIKKPFNIKLTSEPKDKLDINQSTNNDSKKSIKLHNNSQNLVQLLDDHGSFNDEVIIIDDDINVNVNDNPLAKTKEVSSNDESKSSALTALSENENSNNSKSISHQEAEKINKNDKTPWNMFAKTQNSVNTSKKSSILDASKIGNSNETSNSFIKELDFDFDQSISQTSLTELYNGVEEIVEMHSFDNEELNSLIDCSTLNSSVTEECQNTITSDQNDSSVSESDSTIGAFDSFAQITRVPQRSSKSLYKPTGKQIGGGKDLEHDEGFVQSDEIDDDQNTAVSVTGIPILQGVISDVMSKIDSDRVAALKNFKVVDSQNALINDIVEISSDEEETENMLSSNNQQLKTKESENLMKKLNIDESIKNKEKAIKIVYNDCESDTKKNKHAENNSSDELKDCIITKHEVINIKNYPSCVMKDSAANKMNLECIKSINEIILMKTPEEVNNEDKLSITDKTEMENELKKVKEIELKTIEEKLHSEEALIIKDVDEYPIKEVEEKTLKNDEIIKNTLMKEAEKKEFEAEIMQRAHKKIEIKKSKLADSTKAKEAEMKIIKETEIKKTKELELINKTREVERLAEVRLIRGAEHEIQCIGEVYEMNRIIEVQLKRAKDTEVQRAKEAQIQRIKEAEIRRAKDAEIQKIKEIEIKKAQVVELQKTKEEEIRIGKEAKIIQMKDVESKNAKDADIKKNKDIDIKEKKELDKLKDSEMRKNKDIEIKEAGKKVKEVETVNVKEIESRKRGDIEKRLQDKKKEMIASDDQLKKAKNLEQSKLEMINIDANEIRSNDFVEGMKSKEQEIKKVKEIETNPVEVKIITRTRGLKVEEEKLRSSIRSSSSMKSMESSLNSSEINKNENIEHEVNEKSRTRSSMSLKQSKTSENKSTLSHKSKDQNEIDAVLKETVGKTRTSTSSHHEVPTTSYSFKNNAVIPKSELSIKTFFENTCNKQQLSVAVVLLNADEVPNLIERGYCQVSDSTIKPLGIKAVHNNLPNLSSPPNQPSPPNSPKTIILDEKPKKSLSKKRGRKRRISNRLSNEELQLPNSNEPTHQNGTTIAAKKSFTDEVKPPLAKRTRRSIESFVDNRETGSNDEKDIDTNLKKKVLKIIYNNLCENNKYLSTLERQVKDITPENNIVIKIPIELRDIKRKISSGEIKKISELQIELMLMSYNAIMMNKTNTTVYEDATHFQGQLRENVQLFKDTIVDEFDNESHNLNNESKNFVIMVNSSDEDFNSDDLLISEESEDDYHGCIDNNTPILKSDKSTFFKKFDFSSEDSIDSQCGSPPYKKRKIKCISSNNSSGSNYSNDSNSDADSNYN